MYHYKKESISTGTIIVIIISVIIVIVASIMFYKKYFLQKDSYDKFRNPKSEEDCWFTNENGVRKLNNNCKNTWDIKNMSDYDIKESVGVVSDPVRLL